MFTDARRLTSWIGISADLQSRPGGRFRLRHFRHRPSAETLSACSRSDGGDLIVVGDIGMLPGAHETFVNFTVSHGADHAEVCLDDKFM
jgi:hypothetical protein